MYTLLTGSTGMLGRYLLRDLLLRGCGTAVLVRPSRRESAAERVDVLLNYWEEAWQRTLPRPVVLTGDIIQGGLGLDASDRRWLSANCESMIHSAASLTFYEEDGEPWRSNVQGVAHVLDACRELGIRRLYHISTAYTCGLREGTIYEDELDVGQEFGNDYERSKVQAERLVRQADWLDVAAIFRPSIIVGDSQTGFSSTFHGFYTPLRLVCALRTQLSHDQVFAHDFMGLMGLSGDEGKNLVPVEWVSQAIALIIERYPTASRTYAIASPTPVTSSRVLGAIRAVTEEYGVKTRSSKAAAALPLDATPEDPILAAYLEQLRTYRSYWRNDPVFDCTNTRAALPDLPCPVLTDEILKQLAKWAVKAKFSPPVATSKHHASAGWIRADRNATRVHDGALSDDPRVVTITGRGGGSWTFDAQDGSGLLRVCDGRLDGAPELQISSEIFGQIIGGKTTVTEAAGRGDLVTIGGPGDLNAWQSLFATARDQSLFAAEASLGS